VGVQFHINTQPKPPKNLGFHNRVPFFFPPSVTSFSSFSPHPLPPSPCFGPNHWVLPPLVLVEFCHPIVSQFFSWTYPPSSPSGFHPSNFPSQNFQNTTPEADRFKTPFFSIEYPPPVRVPRSASSASPYPSFLEVNSFTALLRPPQPLLICFQA